MLKFVEGENPLISILKFLKPVSCHKLKINLKLLYAVKNENYISDSIIFFS